jgi:hypothetical protein
MNEKENKNIKLDKDRERYIKNLQIHKENTSSNLKYSSDRFDILIITLSSGGIVFSMGFVKDIISPKVEIDFLLLKIAWIFFGSSIVSNLISQVTGYFANLYENRITKNIIRHERGKPIIGDQEENIRIRKFINLLTYLLNGTSFLLFIAAVILLIVFININLK